MAERASGWRAELARGRSVGGSGLGRPPACPLSPRALPARVGAGGAAWAARPEPLPFTQWQAGSVGPGRAVELARGRQPLAGMDACLHGRLHPLRFQAVDNKYMPVTVAPSPGRGATVAPPPAIRKRSGGQVETGLSGLVLEMTGCNALHVCTYVERSHARCSRPRVRLVYCQHNSTRPGPPRRSKRVPSGSHVHEARHPDHKQGMAGHRTRPTRTCQSPPALLCRAAIQRYGCTAHARHHLLARALNSAPAASCLNKASNSNHDDKKLTTKHLDDCDCLRNI